MTDNMKAFLAEIEKNDELKTKLTALKNPETAKDDVIEIAKEYGFVLKEEDFYSDNSDDASGDELSAVTGGSRPALGSSSSGFIFDGGRSCGCIFSGVGNGGNPPV